ncbi:AraC family transcriptional regulator [Marinibaculum pumilum]|uniref:AraC family transcriptional regulator n=1 Tax=Marinibaculum pumilum TaxID=1766165 RepID=A0ABV7L3U8_9PROT
MTAEQSVPLAGHMLFRSRDLDEARDRVARVFCPHRLETIGRGSRLDARHHHYPGERLSLNYIDYGAKALIAPGELQDFFLLQIPLSGSAAIVNGTQDYCSHPGRAALLNPHLATRMIWDENCRQVLVWIERQALERFLAEQSGAPLRRPLTFLGGLDMTRPEGARLRRLVMHLVAEVDAGIPSIGTGGLMGRQIEAAVMAGLLEAAAHDQGDAADAGAALPRQVRRAEAFIMANLEQALALEDIARAAGVSMRGLQQGFRDHRDTTPMAFLRDARLERAHRDLQSAAPGCNVTAVALRWGFAHLGRFAQVYRARYGCSPGQTLNAARGAGFEG